MTLLPSLTRADFVTLLLHGGFALANEPVPPARRTTAVTPEFLMPRAVTSFGAASLDGYVYTLGGWYGTPHDYHREQQSASFARLNPLDGTWQELPSPGAMQSVALVAHDGALYRVGGMLARNAPGEEQDLISSAAFARFDPSFGEWTDLPDLPGPRSSHMAAVSGDELWVVGGWDIAAPERTKWATQAWSIDLSDANAEWQAHDVPFERRALGVAALDDVVVAIGGIDPFGDRSTRMDVLSVGDRTWSRGPDFPQTGFGLAAVGHAGRIWASAGDGGLHSWAPGEDAWRLETTWIFPRFFHQLVPSGDGILALGGVARGGRIRHVERLSLTAEPDVRLTHWRLPRPGRAIEEQGLFRSRNALFAFGGRDAEGRVVDDVFRLDLARLCWERRTPLPAPLAQARVAAPGADKALALATTPDGPATSRGSVRPATFEFEPKYDLWTEVTTPVAGPRDAVPLAHGDRTLWFVPHGSEPGAAEVVLPRPRVDFAVAVANGRAHVLGGSTPDGRPLTSVDVYDLDAERWSEGPPVPSPRDEPAVAVIGERMFVAGGRTPGGHVRTSVEALDVATGHWTTVTDELPIAAATLHLVAFGDRLVAYAPEHDGTAVDVVLIDVGARDLHDRDIGGHFGG